MAEEQTSTYDIGISHGWSPVHTISAPGQGVLGKLCVRRNGLGVVVGGRYSPEKGEVLEMRRDPGLLRSQFSLWTDGREWLGSSLRWSFLGREIVLHTGSKPLRILPLGGFRPGWTLQAPKTGEMARILARPFGRTARVEVYRRLEFETVVFSYFLGSMILTESLWPGPHVEAPPPPASKPSSCAST